MLRSWHRVVRAAVRTQRTRHALPRPSVQEVSRALPVTQFRSFSAQTASHSTAEPPVNNVIAFSTRDASLPPSNRKSRQSSVNLSRRVSERVLAAPESSYGEALRAFEYLRDTRSRLKERHYLALIEKASVEQQYHAIRTHFTQFCDALNANQIEVYRGSKFTWESYASERLQIHRHVLWAMLQTGLPTTRFRAMQRHFRKHELATMRNRLELYESDALNFLLRMECTFQFVDPLARDQGRETWITRVVAILDAMRSLRYRTNYSSSHALFHFLMHRPDVALSGNKESEHKDEASQEDNAEDQAIYDMLTSLLDEYPHTLERDPRRLSLAVSTAASAGRLWLAVRILRDADARGIAVDSASFAHVVAMAKDDDTRLAIADLYTRAKEHDRLYDNEDNHSMKKYLLQYAIHDGNFTQIMELLHEMEYSKIQAPPRIVAMLFASIAKYRAQIRHKLREKDPRTIETALNECPSVLQLMKSFPHVIDRNTHTGSHGVLLALRSGDVDVALTVLRTTVQHTKVPLRPEVFSQALYAVLVSDANQRDVLAAHEVEQLYDARFPNQRDVLNAQLLHLCASNNDLGTMVAVLNHWHDHAPVPLSKRTRQRVFDVISSHLKAIRKQDKDESESDEGDARYKLGGLELSFRGVLEKYPMLVPLDTATINTALMRSATAGLVDDVATLLSVAHTKDLAIETVVYKAALDVLHKAAMEKNATADVALRTTIETMEANGSWARVREQFPEFVASIELEG